MFSVLEPQAVANGMATDGILFVDSEGKAAQSNDNSWWEAVEKALKEPRETTSLAGVNFERSWDLFRVPPKFRAEYMKKLQERYPEWKIHEYELSGIWIDYPKNVYNNIDDEYREAFDKHYNAVTEADHYEACLSIDKCREDMLKKRRVHPGDVRVTKLTEFVRNNLRGFKDGNLQNIAGLTDETLKQKLKEQNELKAKVASLPMAELVPIAVQQVTRALNKRAEEEPGEGKKVTEDQIKTVLDRRYNQYLKLKASSYSYDREDLVDSEQCMRGLASPSYNRSFYWMCSNVMMEVK